VTLHPIPWGKPDRKLAMAVCWEVERAMPCTLWTWAPRAYVPRWVGWLAVALLVLAVLAGFGGRS